MPSDAAAEARWRRALQLNPFDRDALAGLADLAHRGGRNDVARRLLMHAAVAHPADGVIWASLARDDLMAGRIADAHRGFDHARHLERADLVVWSGWAATAGDLGRHDRAAAGFRILLALAPDLAIGWHQRAKSREAAGPRVAALPDYRRAALIDPNDAAAEVAWGELLLLTGAIAEGFRHYEARRRAWGFGQVVPPHLPAWDGRRLHDGHLLLIGEQGNGDSLFFARFVPWLLHQGLAQRVTIVCLTALARLLAESFAAEPIAIVPIGPDLRLPLDRVGPVDAYALLGSLPTILRFDAPHAPAKPYLRVHQPPPTLPDRRPKVGLVWAGNPHFATDHARSPGLEPVRPLLDVRSVQWIVLQAGQGRAALTTTSLPTDVIDLGATFTDFADCAAAMMACDLIITSCTGPLHVAAGLGRPTWAMLSSHHDWRWILGRDDSPWYPTVRLFRQTTPGDWGGVVQKIADELNATKSIGSAFQP